MEILAFCVITFEPIEVQTPSAPQNDCLNLSFVKNCRKLARNDQKVTIWRVCGGGYQQVMNKKLLSKGSMTNFNKND